MLKTKPILAKAIDATDEALVIVLPRRRVRVPWSRCSPRLASASNFQRRQAELSPGGYGVHWPALDEDLSIAGLVRQADTNP